MSKLYRTPIEVKLSPDGLPAAFRWRRRWYYVTNCVVIQDKPAWPQRYGNYDYRPSYRCEVRQGLVCDLVKDGEEWILERVWD